MELSLATPSILFPAISLLMLAYTNRFLALASLIRRLHDEYNKTPDPVIVSQIQNLRKRLNLIRAMQSAGVASLLVCVLTIFMLLLDITSVGRGAFAFSLVLLMISLIISLWEIQISTRALQINLGDMEKL